MEILFKHELLWKLNGLGGLAVRALAWNMRDMLFNSNFKLNFSVN